MLCKVIRKSCPPEPFLETQWLNDSVNVGCFLAGVFSRCSYQWYNSVTTNNPQNTIIYISEERRNLGFSLLPKDTWTCSQSQWQNHQPSDYCTTLSDLDRKVDSDAVLAEVMSSFINLFCDSPEWMITKWLWKSGWRTRQTTWNTE